MARNINQRYNVATAGKKIKDDTKRGRIRSFFTTGFLTFSVLLSISVVAFTFVFFLSTVFGGSMMNTLNASDLESHYGGRDKTDENWTDHVLVNRYAKAKPGDIIVVRYHASYDEPNDRSIIYGENGALAKGQVDEIGPYDFFIKRLIAVGGDTISFHEVNPLTDDYKIKVNGLELVEEDYMSDNEMWGNMMDFRAIFFNESFTRTQDGNKNVFTLKIKEDQMFFMGDNRESTNYSPNSYDCRMFGARPMSELEGVVTSIIEYPESIPNFILRKIGEFFTFNWLF